MEAAADNGSLLDTSRFELESAPSKDSCDVMRASGSVLRRPLYRFTGSTTEYWTVFDLGWTYIVNMSVLASLGDSPAPEEEYLRDKKR